METYYKNIDAKFLAADELVEYGDVREAKDLLDEIIMDDPTYGRAHNHLGWIYANKLTDYKRAERHLKLAMRYSPDYPAGYRNYAHLLLATNRIDELLAHIDKSMEIAGIDYASMLRFRALAFEQKGETAKAKKLMRQSRDMAVNDEFLEMLQADLKRLRTKMGLLRWWMA